MVGFNNWCDTDQARVGAHNLKRLRARAANLNGGRDAIAAKVPTHYASEERIAANLARLGKDGAAEFIKGKLPTTKTIRSGDLGEILATEYVGEQTEYGVPVKRLRWKDHRNMAMRGDDVIGIRQDNETGRLRFLKAESKSRVALSAGVVARAREGLDKDGGLPSPHALSFISDRLFEAGDNQLVDAIDAEQMRHGIVAAQVKHLTFVFCGNNPTVHLQASLNAYAGPIAQEAVGLQVDAHTAFVQSVYEIVIQNADND